jgi:hypothetical protein
MACGLPPHSAECLWLSAQFPFPVFPEAQPQEKTLEASPERHSLSALCCGRAAILIKHFRILARGWILVARVQKRGSIRFKSGAT